MPEHTPNADEKRPSYPLSVSRSCDTVILKSGHRHVLCQSYLMCSTTYILLSHLQYKLTYQIHSKYHIYQWFSNCFSMRSALHKITEPYAEIQCAARSNAEMLWLEMKAAGLPSPCALTQTQEQSLKTMEMTDTGHVSQHEKECWIQRKLALKPAESLITQHAGTRAIQKPKGPGRICIRSTPSLKFWKEHENTLASKLQSNKPKSWILKCG